MRGELDETRREVDEPGTAQQEDKRPDLFENFDFEEEQHRIDTERLTVDRILRLLDQVLKSRAQQRRAFAYRLPRSSRPSHSSVLPNMPTITEDSKEDLE
mmetsp:Transcript_3073/g.10160  ORF Transcript_3073/g.10160 Transcript_3073/m.10160 type:complete len:100 (+) Transcript_3073:616-915(+)